MKRNEHTFAFFKKGSITEKEVIRLLIITNFVFILFFIGIRFNGFLETGELPTITIDETFSSGSNSDSNENYVIRVDINTDNIFLLCQLPGIGEAKASAILEYRKENGDFCFKEELLNVPGIGESIYNNIKELVYIESAVTEPATVD